MTATTTEPITLLRTGREVQATLLDNGYIQIKERNFDEENRTWEESVIEIDCSELSKLAIAFV